MIAAGGGRTVITFHVGQQEAQSIVDEIAVDFGPGRCTSLQYNAASPAGPQLATLSDALTQVYYFATPQIFRQTSELYSPVRFAQFQTIYLDGFYELCKAVRGTMEHPVSVFYPSSVAIEKRPREMTEYSMVKAAGEQLAADINKFWKGITVHTHRLPRLLTDQTATIMPIEGENPIDVMLPIIRKMRRITPLH